MRIEFWIDYNCPITYLTHKNLIEAINELNLKEYELYYRSYELTFEELNYLSNTKKYSDLLEQNNLSYKYFNTDLIHQMAHLAKRKDCAKEFTINILNEVFVKNNDNIDKAKLTEIALQSGLDEENVGIVLNTLCYTKQIQSNKINAVNRGISAIPHIRVNIKDNLSGYQDKETIKKMLMEVLSRTPKTEVCGEYCEY